MQAQQNQSSIDTALDTIESQQQELDRALSAYETKLSAHTDKNGQAAKSITDKEREQSYVINLSSPHKLLSVARYRYR
jgi:hypothetical protein